MLMLHAPGTVPWATDEFGNPLQGPSSWLGAAYQPVDSSQPYQPVDSSQPYQPVVNTPTPYKPIDYSQPGVPNTRRTIAVRSDLMRRGLQIQVDSLLARLTAQHAAGQLKNCKDFKLSINQRVNFCSFWADGDKMTAYTQRHIGVRGAVDPVNLLRPLGVIQRLGVTFGPTEVKEGNPTFPKEATFERTYRPTADQTFLADRAVYVRSQLMIAESPTYKVDLSERKNLEQILASNDTSIGLIGLLTRHDPLPSLSTYMNFYKSADGGPWLETNIPGFSLNPIPPTYTELNKEGGALAYYKRGGYLISRDIAQGRKPVEQRSLTFSDGVCWINAGEGCNSITGGGAPVSSQHYIEGSWLSFVTVKPSGERTLRVQRKEVGAAGKISGAIRSLANALKPAFCTALPMMTGYNAGLVTEACYDNSTNKTCKKGAPNCVCVMPTGAQAIGVTAANAMLTNLCGKLNPPPVVTAPPPPVQLPPAFKVTPLMLLLGAAALGAIVITRKPKSTAIAGTRGRSRKS
jgi:hypothetical protein